MWPSCPISNSFDLLLFNVPAEGFRRKSSPNQQKLLERLQEPYKNYANIINRIFLKKCLNFSISKLKKLVKCLGFFH